MATAHLIGTDSAGQKLYSHESAEALAAQGVRFWADEEGLHERLVTTTLKDYETGEVLREATEEERRASEEQSHRDGGAGVILVEGRRCYVED